MRVAAIVAIGLSMIGSTRAEDATRRPIQIGPQDLRPALQTYARLERLHVLFLSEDVQNRKTEGVSGTVTNAESLAARHACSIGQRRGSRGIANIQIQTGAGRVGAVGAQQQYVSRISRGRLRAREVGRRCLLAAGARGDGPGHLLGTHDVPACICGSDIRRMQQLLDHTRGCAPAGHEAMGL